MPRRKRCARCHRIVVKHFRRTKLPVTVKRDYEIGEMVDFQACSIFCVMCLHSLSTTLYGGTSEGQNVHVQASSYEFFRVDGQQVA
jgi:hypothetical protein